MYSSLHLALAALGAIAGVAYSALGIKALKHLTDASEAERVVGWSLLWFTEAQRYTSEGKRLCKIGGLLFVTGVACWVAFALLARK